MVPFCWTESMPTINKGETGEYMYCKKCGKELRDGSKFCCYCGERLSPVESFQLLGNAYFGNRDGRTEQIIGNNAAYYIQRFRVLRDNGKDKINWASLFLGFLHAGYRNVWKQWLRAMWLPMVIGWGILLLYAILLPINETVAAVIALGYHAVNIWLFVEQIRFAKRFNRLYMQHVEQKLSQNDLTADVSKGRSAVAGLTLGLVNILIFGIGAIVTVIGTLIFAENQDYVYDDYEEYSSDIEAVWPYSNVEEDMDHYGDADGGTAAQTDQGLSWVGDFQRTYGPDAGLTILEEDEDTILFSAGIGGSGYLSFLDMRACVAYKGDAVTAYYYEPETDYAITFTYRADGSLLLEENEDHCSGVNLAGVYVPEDVAVFPDCEYVFPDSDTYEIFMEDSESLTDLEREIARNEIYARHGVIFKDECLQNYFESCSWYDGQIRQEEFSDDILNDVEMTNIWILK